MRAVTSQHLRSAAAAVITTLLLSMGIGAAQEGAQGNVYTGADGVTYYGVGEWVPGNAPGSSGGSNLDCMYFIGEYGTVWAVHSGGVGYTEPPLPPDLFPELYEQLWIHVFCTGPDGNWAVYQMDEVTDPPPVQAVQDAAEDMVDIPLPDVKMSPVEDAFQVVGIDSWFWLGAEDVNYTPPPACIINACGQVFTTFDRVEFDMGNGDTETCELPDLREYDFGSTEAAQRALAHCGYVYEEDSDTGTFPVSATTYWDGFFECTYDSTGDGVPNASCGAYALPDQFVQAGPVLPIEVRSYESVLTSEG